MLTGNPAPAVMRIGVWRSSSFPRDDAVPGTFQHLRFGLHGLSIINAMLLITMKLVVLSFLVFCYHCWGLGFQVLCNCRLAQCITLCVPYKNILTIDRNVETPCQGKNDRQQNYLWLAHLNEGCEGLHKSCMQPKGMCLMIEFAIETAQNQLHT